MLKCVSNVNVISGEECISQHRLLVGNITLSAKPKQPPRLPPRLKTWKLKDDTIRTSFEEEVKQKCQSVPVGVNEAWNHLKTALVEAAESICGWTKGPVRHNETFWWNEDVSNVINEKRKAWKCWKSGGPKADYIAAKRAAKLAVYTAKCDAQSEQFSSK